MKIGFAALLALLLALALAGCAAPNKSVTITLDENPTTGYSWSYTMEGTALKETDNAFQAPDAQGKVGVGGVRTWTFTGEGDGEVTLTFLYSQPWAGGNKGEGRIYRYSVEKGTPTLLSEQTVDPPVSEEVLVRVDAVYVQDNVVVMDVVYLNSEWKPDEQDGVDMGYTEFTEVPGSARMLPIRADAYVDFSEDMGPDTVQVTPAELAEKFAAGDFTSGRYYTALIEADEVCSLTFYYTE